jgi:hypothetical protein
MKPLLFVLFVLLAALTKPRSVSAQAREPLCRTVRVHRVASSPEPVRSTNDSLAVITLRTRASDGTQYVVVWREVHSATQGGTRLRLARLNHRLNAVGSPESLAIEGLSSDQGDGALSSANLPDGGVVMFRLQNSLYLVRVSGTGQVRESHPLFAGGAQETASNNTPIAWTSMIERDGDGSVEGSVVALVGYQDGSVRAFRLLADGSVRDDTTWTQRVGGVMRLLPTPPGTPTAALLERPLPGIGMNGERPAIQMLLTLDEHLTPIATPERTGLAQFPWDASAARQGQILLSQWVTGQGVAIARFSPSAQRVSTEVPRLWYAQPALSGFMLATASVSGADGISYSLVISQDSRAGLLEGHMAWIAPSGEPALRRNVVSLNGALVSRPRLLPAADGFAALIATNDESGFALEAHHVRCDLVRRAAE